MKLNTHSYVHVKIRMLCNFVEMKTGLKLITNLSDNFSVITFQSEYSYINIFYKKNAYTSLSVKLDKTVRDAIEDILFNLNWLDLGIKLAERRKKDEAASHKRNTSNRKKAN